MTMDNKIMIFNRPLWFTKEEKDIREIIEIWGCIIPAHITPIKKHLDDYLNYLCGVSKWEQEGNSTNGYTWTSNLTGEQYNYFDPFVQKLMKRSRQQMHITYMVFEVKMSLDKDTEGMQEGEFLISRSLYNNIVENGVIVDVQNAPDDWS